MVYGNYTVLGLLVFKTKGCFRRQVFNCPQTRLPAGRDTKSTKQETRRCKFFFVASVALWETFLIQPLVIIIPKNAGFTGTKFQFIENNLLSKANSAIL